MIFCGYAPRVKAKSIYGGFLMLSLFWSICFARADTSFASTFAIDNSPLRIEPLNAPQLVVTASGGMARLLVQLKEPVSGPTTVRLTIDHPCIATFIFEPKGAQVVLFWEGPDWATPRVVTIGKVTTSRRGGIGKFSIKFEVNYKGTSDQYTELKKIPGIVLYESSERCYPDAVLPRQGFFSQPYGSDCTSYKWMLQRMDEPAVLRIRASLGSVIYVSVENQQPLLVEAGQERDCQIVLPRGQITPVYLDTYADTRFGLKHSRYEISACNSEWREATHAAAFSPRDGAGVVNFKGRLWLIGGWDGKDALSEIWNSSDGVAWSLVATAPWAPRHGMGIAILNDKIWILGGDGYNDVWSSDDGLKWELVTKEAPWGKRYSPNVFSYGGKLWLMGGQWWSEATDSANAVIGYNDVWSSEDGLSWQRVNAAAPWAPRSLVHGSVVHQNRMWIIGGGLKGGESEGVRQSPKTLVEYNDVWSTTDGIGWRLETMKAPWRPRTHFSVVEFAGRIWLTDGSIGTQNEQGSEVWSSADGRTWTQQAEVPWSGRHASSLVAYKGGLWLIAGRLYNDIYNFYPVHGN